METMVVVCPDCQTKMRVPESAVGKKVRCKNCEATFPVKPSKKAAEEQPAPKKPKAGKPAKEKEGAAKAKPSGSKPPAGGKPAPSPHEQIDDDDDGKAYGATEEDEGFRCPQCATEMAGPDAIICIECGFNTRTRQHGRTRRVADITGQDKFLWLLPGILCVIGILSLIGYWFIHHFVLPDALFDNFETLVETKGSRREALSDDQIPWWGFIFKPAIELWIGIAFAFFCFWMGQFAVKRLILHPNPPEVEVGS